MKFALLGLGLGLAAGCRDGDDDEEDGVAGSDGKGEIVCGPFMAFAMGARWEWANRSDWDEGQEAHADESWEVTTVDTDQVTLTVVSNFEDSSMTAEATAKAHYTCDDWGAWLNSVAANRIQDFDGEPQERDWTAEYDGQGYPVLPIDLEVGTTWEGDVSGEVREEGDRYNFSFAVAGEAVGTGTIDVPAGSFEAVEVRVVSDDFESASWYAEGVGMVRTDAMELASYSL